MALVRTHPRCNLPARRGLIDTFTLSYGSRPHVPMQERMHSHEISLSTSRTNARTLTREVGRRDRLVSRLVSHAEGCSCSGSRGGLSATFVHPIGAPRLPSADRQLTLKPTVGAALWRGVDAFHRSCAAPISSSGIRHLTLQRRAHSTSFKHIWLDFRVYLVSFCGGRTGGVRCIFFGHVRINSC